ncbi:hypothetical protein [Pleionea sediminis]|uniref:hypothetical protein n=1 Tax=Pleionea sediminis TaxID=2569479 RepID=UPI00118568A2|nr:hypothetical protein [Pleionea sediminis]
MKKIYLLLFFVVSVGVVYALFKFDGYQKVMSVNNVFKQTDEHQDPSKKNLSHDDVNSQSSTLLHSEASDSFINKEQRQRDSIQSARLSDNNKRWWFDTPQFVSEDRFSKADTPIELDTSCQSKSWLNSQLSLEENFERKTYSDTQSRYQEDLFYLSLTQFWQIDDNYYQFVAIWDRDMPAHYRYEFYISSDATFESEVTAIDIPIDIPQVKDVLATNEFVAQLISHYVQKGAQIGSRILESSINDPKGDQSITLVNSKIKQWQTAEFNCDSGSNLSSAYCYCNVGDNS